MHSLPRITIYATVVGLFLFGLSLNADAAPLRYTADTQVSLTSPVVNLTIASGSVADQVIVNATSVMVTMSATTGGIFSISATSTGLTAPNAAGLSCNQGLQGASFNTSTVSTQYTITPTSAPCSDPGNGTLGTAGTVSSGGGSGGGSGFIPSTTHAPAVTPTSISPKDQLAALQAKLQVLLSQLSQAKNQGPSLPPSPQNFSKNLVAGSRGNDVSQLQLFLIAKSAGTAAKALASSGATGRFGPLTKKALIEYQKSVGITPASGYFGPKTRAYINSLK